jgi:hypothetical protein
MAEPEAPANPVADPAPLGLAAFALTTFLLSAENADLTRGGAAWLGYALAYGGLVQLLAGMWEFRNRNTFGALAFSSYGAFWIGLFFYGTIVGPGSPNAANDKGWILLAFAIFNTYMLLAATRINPGDHRDRAVHRELQQQHEHHQDRWIRRHPDRARGLVHLVRRGQQLAGRRHEAAGRAPDGHRPYHRRLSSTATSAAAGTRDPVLAAARADLDAPARRPRTAGPAMLALSCVPTESRRGAN